MDKLFNSEMDKLIQIRLYISFVSPFSLGALSSLRSADWDRLDVPIGLRNEVRELLRGGHSIPFSSFHTRCLV